MTATDATHHPPERSTANWVGRSFVEVAEEYAEREPAGTRERTLHWQDPMRSVADMLGKSGLEQLLAAAHGDIPPPPIGVMMRITPTEVSCGKVALHSLPGEDLFNLIGSASGGYSATLLDCAMGTAVQSTLAVGDAYTTQSLEVKMMRPITASTGAVIATGRVTYRGHRQAVVEGDVVATETGKVMSSGTMTCIVMEGALAGLG